MAKRPPDQQPCEVSSSSTTTTRSSRSILSRRCQVAPRTEHGTRPTPTWSRRPATMAGLTRPPTRFVRMWKGPRRTDATRLDRHRRTGSLALQTGCARLPTEQLLDARQADAKERIRVDV